MYQPPPSAKPLVRSGQDDDPVFLKIKWAYHHLGEFHKLHKLFIESDPYGIVIERDPQTHETLYRLSKDPAVPVDFALIAGDVFQTLRTALDYLACALVEANDGKITSQTGFPILDPASPEFERSFARKVEGMDEKAKDLIFRIEPYKGGDSVLWRLHELNRREKHRLLFTVGSYLENFSITQHVDATNPPLDVLERMARAYDSAEVWQNIRKASFPLKAGDILLRDFPNAKENKNIKFSIQIAINEPGICEGEALFAVLRVSVTRVMRVAERFAGMY